MMILICLMLFGLLWPVAAVFATRLTDEQEATCMRVLVWVVVMLAACTVALGMSLTHSIVEKAVLVVFALSLGYMAHAVFFSRRSTGGAHE